MPKNIVVCCDGVDQWSATHSTNVVKLYSTLVRSRAQVAFYSSGGSDPERFTGIGSSWARVKSLSFGYGISKGLSDSYQFLMHNFTAGDRLFVFGVGRGAYVARALSGMLHLVGLLAEGNEGMISDAIRMAKSEQIDFRSAAQFKQTFSRECKPHFVGVWDTVNSLGWIYNVVRLPFTRATNNPDLGIVRHAVSIDERRAFFRPNLFGEAGAPEQDIKEVWFAGVHSDVGGSYPESESQLSQIALEWMLAEAESAGLSVDRGRKADILGAKPPYVSPDPNTSNHHQSLRDAWWIAELWPKIEYRVTTKGFAKSIRINLGRRRGIRSGSLIHETVKIRMEGSSGYRPKNIPTEYAVEPWVRTNIELSASTTSTERYSGSVTASAVPEIPDELVKDCAAGKCVLFAGAGLSAQAGVPTWVHGLTKIIDDLAIGAEASEAWAPLRTRLSEGDMEINATAELLASRLSRDDLRVRVKETFAKTNSELSTTHQALSEIPFAFALTCNWDDLLERTFESRGGLILTPKDSAQFPVLLREGRFFVLKIYGNANDSPGFLFTTAEYRDSVNENPDYARFITSLFSSNTVLFIGASLKGVEDFLSALRIRGQTARAHYALVPETADSGLQDERFRSSYHVRLLPYRESAAHAEVGVFVSALREAVNKQKRPVIREIGSPPLERVELVNIGSFKKLDIRFDQSWNVLLANNGLGKSTLLKAIALGLCGNHEKTAPAARSLLRVGETSGYIKLWIGEDIYESELVRDGSEVKVRPRRYTPLQSGTSVVLGFPPLRGVSLRRPTGVSHVEERPYPVVEDLLPLITDGVDSRVDNLKQWVVNTAVRARTDPAASRALTEFFEVVRQISKDVNVSFSRVEDKTFQVMMKTADGEVPIESLSQGMSSVIGWVGALLERMFEIYAKEKHPERMPALVLVDEIDAHMHPAWQQVLVEALSNCFKKVQFIVSTHSPLIVGGLEPHQVHRFERDAKGVVQVTRPAHSLKGVGAAGLLTSELFGLASQLDIKTAQALDQKRQLTAKRLDTTITETERAAIDADLEKVEEQVKYVDATRFVRDPLFRRFVEAMSRIEKDAPQESQLPALTAEENERKAQVAEAIVRDLVKSEDNSLKGKMR
jgi:uncharacterized protein (DUF2235 family)